MEKEIWREAQYINLDGSITVFEGYEVSNLGRVKSLNYKRTSKEKIRESQTTDKLGHQQVCLRKDNKRYMRSVHRLVLSTFNPESYFGNAVVDHIDSNPKNNKLDNLHWVTYKENNSTEHARQATSEALKGSNSPWFGKHHSGESKKKMSEAHKGSNHPKAQLCVYDNRTFGCIKDAYEYAQSHGYNKTYLTFKNMIKKEQHSS